MKKNTKLSYNPWAALLVFAISSFLLGRPSFSMSGKMALILLGLLLPFFLFSRMKLTDLNPRPDLFSTEFFKIPSFVWVILPLLALTLRFFKLTTLFVWPDWDESLKGFLAFESLEEGRYQFFNGFNQAPPAFIQTVALFLRFHSSPLLCLWFPSALASSLSVVFSFLAARQFFSLSLSFLCAFGMAFGFWPLFTGRLGLEWSYFLLWECLLFFLLGLVFGTKRRGLALNRSFLCLLGFGTGIGSMLSATWPVISFGVILFVLVRLFKEPDRRAGYSFFFLGLLPSLIPFIESFRMESYGGHILSTFLLNSSFDWKLPLVTAWGYLSALFWGSTAAYVPRGMGLFNPFWGALFWMGLLELLSSLRDSRVQGLFLLFVFFSLPAFLLGGLEPFRLVQLLPLILLVSGLGIQALLVSVEPGKRLSLLFLILLFSSGLDLYRLVRPYWNWENHTDLFAQTGKSLEKLQAYQILSGLQALYGPGLVFSEMVPETGDLSLAYMSLPFNAALRPGISLGQTHWAAFLAPVHYSPYLSRLFPGMHGTLLPSQISGRVSDHFFGVVPLTTQNLPVFQRWLSASQILWEADSRIIHLSDGRPRREVLEGLLKAYPVYPPDPFLQSCYFEKLLYNYSWEKTFHPEDAWTNWKNFSSVFHRAFDQSCKDAALEVKWGELLALENRDPVAR